MRVYDLSVKPVKALAKDLNYNESSLAFGSYYPADLRKSCSKDFMTSLSLRVTNQMPGF